MARGAKERGCTITSALPNGCFPDSAQVKPMPNLIG
jgi:hypothetical protein